MTALRFVQLLLTKQLVCSYRMKAIVVFIRHHDAARANLGVLDGIVSTQLEAQRAIGAMQLDVLIGIRPGLEELEHGDLGKKMKTAACQIFPSLCN